MPGLVSSSEDNEQTEKPECLNELSLHKQASEDKSDICGEETVTNGLPDKHLTHLNVEDKNVSVQNVSNSDDATLSPKEENCTEEISEDYEQLRMRNIKEKEKMLSEIFKSVDMQEMKEIFTRSPKRKRVDREKKTPKIVLLPRKHLPRRSASKAASERLAVECSVDDEVAELSGDDETFENGKKRKVVVAFRPRQRHTTTNTEPRIILSADQITEDDLKNVADIVTEKVYTQSGTTCHQCRQKTNDMKTICRSDKCSGVRGYFCGPCLRNRYGEDARTALKDPGWMCPPCRGICNCSICRNRAGIRATGILTPIAKRCGYASVKDYLSDHDKYVIKYEDE